MLISYRWICEIAKIKPDPLELGEKLTFSGLELDDLKHVGNSFDKVVLAKVVEKEPHPESKKLSVVKVDSQDEVLQVVCGAPNCPQPGGIVVLAKVGARIGQITIEPRQLAGVESFGMLCSEKELDLGPDDDGIIVFSDIADADIGKSIGEVFELEDWIYDIAVTPNRPDALSHRGVARESALLYGKDFYAENQTCPDSGKKNIDKLVKVEILDVKGCPRYGAALVTDVKVKPSPFNLRYRLHTLGVRPISNIVDITNLVLLELGQPLHAFDLDLLSGKQIIVRSAENGEKMKTLDDMERVFTGEDLLICDAERPVAIAGVMGGLDTEIRDETKNVLFESAYFNPGRIRKTSKKLKLSSESSYRFERGADPSITEAALNAAANMACTYGNGKKAPGIVDCYPKKIEPLSVSIRPQRFNKIMGYELPMEEISRILSGIGGVVKDRETHIDVEVPLFRPDIEREIDLIEEVARIKGLDKVKLRLPKIQCVKPEREEFESAKKAKEILLTLGVTESISYSFVPDEYLDALSMNDNTVSIANPINKERSKMRTTLLAGLMENLKRAGSNFLKKFGQFEAGHVFHNTGEELPLETLNAAAVLSGPAAVWVGDKQRHVDYFDMKGIVQSFIKKYCGYEPLFKESKKSFLHPKMQSVINVNGKDVGFFGEIHPEVLAKLKLPEKVQAMEVSLETLWNDQKTTQAYPLPEYPPVERDVALLVDEDSDAGTYIEALCKACGTLAVSVELFDIYRGKSIPDGKKSMAFSIIYQAMDRTLTDREIDKLHEKAVADVANNLGAIRR